MHFDTVSVQKQALKTQNQLQVQHRLIAVWALAEGTLGGILHGLHIPVTGLVVGSISVCCLALLSRLKRRRGDLLKATMLVLLIKVMLSPHTPPTAYLAVFSQGLAAELIYASGANFKFKSYVFGILTQLQSAIQHLLVVTLVFGMDLWHAADTYLNSISKSLGLEGATYALYLAGFYVGFHALMGIVVGWIAGNLPEWLPKKPAENYATTSDAEPQNLKPKSKKTLRLSGLVLIWLLLLLVFLQSYFGLGPQLLPQTKVAQILIRSALIGFAWYFIFSPLLLKGLHSWLQRKKSPLQSELKAVLDLLPETKLIVQHCWCQSSAEAGIKRLKFFLKACLQQLFALPAEPN